MSNKKDIYDRKQLYITWKTISFLESSISYQEIYTFTHVYMYVCKNYMKYVPNVQFEHQREHHASSVECYMKKYGASEEEAYEVLSELVVNAWNDINEECLKKPMPKQILEVAINFARVMDVFYKDEDIFTHVKKPENGAIISMLIDPVPENWLRPLLIILSCILIEVLIYYHLFMEYN